MSTPALPHLAPGATADVAMLLEGTYPYVGGGVSSWVHQIIRGMPELTFGLVFLGGSRELYGKMKYELPQNVVHLETHYLMEAWQEGKATARRGQAVPFDDNQRLHDWFRRPTGPPPDNLLERVMHAFGTPQGITREDFLYSKEAWERIRQSYNAYCTDPSFVDYFWTVRTMHAPLFMLAAIARTLPRFRVFHSISTGYAGFLGAMLRLLRNRAFILSEHGIYTKERKIDLAHAEWIKDAREAFGGSLESDVSYMRRLWIRFFEGIGRVTYAAADPIVALYEGNRRRQVTDGAEDRRTIVPNGIDLERFAALRPKRSVEIPKVLGLLGRVVPIKDIRTFIRALRTVCTRMPDAEGWLIGPEDEDPGYARECHELVHSLGLDNKIKFLGFQKPDDILPQLGLMMLTSISEALPLVLLEGYAAGIPCVATDVGSCRELVEGNTPADRALGASGRVVSIANPEATAEAALELLGDPHKWRAAQAAGIQRVEQFYTQARMFGSYRKIYQDALAASAAMEKAER
jgi:glycosyltransferase involved in cell wall biosynthesis